MKAFKITFFLTLVSLFSFGQKAHNAYFYIKSPENSVFMYLNDSLLLRDVGYGQHVYFTSKLKHENNN